MMRCVNCSIHVHWRRRHLISSLSVSLQQTLAQWLPEIQLPDEAKICHECFRLLQVYNNNNVHTRQFGHNIICLGCGHSLLSAGLRKHILVFNSPLWQIISSWNPEHLAASWRNNMHVCHKCLIRGERHLLTRKNTTEALDDSMENDVESPVDSILVPVIHIQETNSPEPPVDPMPVTQNVQETNIPEPPAMPTDLIPQPVIRTIETVILPNYKRAANTSRRCIFRGCEEKSWHLIPAFIKSILIKKFKFYVPIHARACNIHLHSNEWHMLPEATEYANDFTPSQIENLIEITNRDANTFDFENIQEMPNHICQYWTGLQVDEFLTLINEVPSLNSIVNPKTSLAIYLIKLKTGETNRRLTTLFNMPRSTLNLHMKRARDCLTGHFMPLGLQQLQEESEVE